MPFFSFLLFEFGFSFRGLLFLDSSITHIEQLLQIFKLKTTRMEGARWRPQPYLQHTHPGPSIVPKWRCIFKTSTSRLIFYLRKMARILLRIRIRILLFVVQPPAPQKGDIQISKTNLSPSPTTGRIISLFNF